MPSSPLALSLRSRGQQGNREEELNMQMDGRKQEADMRRGRRRYGQEGGQKEHSRIQEIYFGQQEGEDVELAARCDINPHQHLWSYLLALLRCPVLCMCLPALVFCHFMRRKGSSDRSTIRTRNRTDMHVISCDGDPSIS